MQRTTQRKVSCNRTDYVPAGSLAVEIQVPDAPLEV